ncbi:MAG TPA: Obg family GTPase CgtA, partial [Anaerolineae bacterium]
RHIERTRVLIHIINGMSPDPLKDFETIQAELASFGHGLDSKPQILAMSKMDLPDAEAAWELYCNNADSPEALRNCVPFSAASGENLRALLFKVVNLLDQLPPVEPTPVESVIEMSPREAGFEIVREGGGFRVIDELLTQRVETTRWDLDQAVQRFQHLLERTGVAKALEQRGIKQGDTVYIGDYELEWGE